MRNSLINSDFVGVCYFFALLLIDIDWSAAQVPEIHQAAAVASYTGH
jgi:hypothetical protein